MIDADVVAVDVRAFRAIGDKVSARSWKIWKRERVDVITRKCREWAATRTITKIVSGDRGPVGCEDRSERRGDSTATCKRELAQDSRLQQLTEVANPHSGCRHRNGLRVTSAAEDRRAVSLSVKGKEKERTIAAVVKRWSTFAGSWQEDWTTNGGVIVMRHVVWHWR